MYKPIKTGTTDEHEHRNEKTIKESEDETRETQIEGPGGGTRNREQIERAKTRVESRREGGKDGSRVG